MACSWEREIRSQRRTLRGRMVGRAMGQEGHPQEMPETDRGWKKPERASPPQPQKEPTLPTSSFQTSNSGAVRRETSAVRATQFMVLFTAALANGLPPRFLTLFFWGGCISGLWNSSGQGLKTELPQWKCQILSLRHQKKTPGFLEVITLKGWITLS